MAIEVCIAGVTGWAGSALTEAVVKAPDMILSGAVARSAQGRSVGEALGLEDAPTVISGTMEEALGAGCQVMVEFTKPEAAKDHVLAALKAGAHVVVGTSGLSDQDYQEIGAEAGRRGLGVLAAGNFALTVVLLQKFARMAAVHLDHWEIVDYASSTKVDSPSGTALELAAQLGRVRESVLDVPLEATHGPRETRGARLNGTQVHSVRLPGFVLSTEVVFGVDDQRLVLRHDSGPSAKAYVDGAMLAIRRVGALKGLHRGLDSVMEI